MASHARPRATSKRRPRWAVLLTGLSVAAVAVVGSVGYSAVKARHSVQTEAAAASNNVPLAVLATSPVNGSKTGDPAAPITVTFSTPLQSGSPKPTISPSLPGSWAALSPSVLTFVPTVPLSPNQHFTIVVPAGSKGIQAANGSSLKNAAVVSFTVAPGSTLRLNQMLAELGYLPVNFLPTRPVTSIQALASAQPGTFSWRWATPPSLKALWSSGTYNTVTMGAIMAFEDQHGMTTDGLAGPAVWAAVLHDVMVGRVDPAAYGYVYVSKALPQTLYLYVNGKLVYTSLVNSGISVAPTESGTWPVYLRYRVTTMSGTNPDGSKYHDTGIPWTSYFNGGDALHGFIRGSYGWPQSLGCIEMPFSNAGVVWPHTPIGTLVTIAG